ncbi:MAG: sulfatase-like hydrolase/transferase [Lachnospiraceae bacterium]
MKQNLVFIMTDQQRADTLGMTVGAETVTPNLNHLTRESTVFEQAYNACPLCVPARTALATGMNPIKNGMMLNDLPGKYARDNETIHQMFYKAGYEVAHIGVNHISIKPALKESVPFAAWEDDDTYAEYAKGKGLAVGRKEEDSVVIDELSDGVYEKHRYSNARTSIWPYDLSDFKDVWFASKAENYIRQNHEKPFALFLYLWAPHPPLIVPKEYWDIFEEDKIELPEGTGSPAQGEPAGRRLGAAARLGDYPPKEGWRRGWHAHLSLTRLCDDQIGRIQRALKETGLDRNTMVVFTTDHGEHMGQHSMYQKMEMYEAAVRVPAIFHSAGQTVGKHLHNRISHLDFVPTLIELFGLQSNQELDGCSLKESIVKGTEPKEKDIFGVYCGNHQFGDMRRMVVRGDYKYIYDNQSEELYNLLEDPWERTNLCPDPAYASKAEELYDCLEEWAMGQNDPFFKKKKKKKNLLFVFADQWRRDAMGFAGKDPVKTPNMDGFAEESVFCTDAVSTFPLCSPHRASLLTGKNPLHTGVFTNCKTGLSMGLKEDEICIGDVLKSCGYQTGYIGKWHLDEPEQNHCPNPQSGAKNWDAYTPPGHKRHGFDFWYSYGAWDQHMSPHYWTDSPKQIQVKKWSPEHETDIALEYIKSHKDSGPFALFVSWNPPHSPYDQVPRKYLDLYKEELPLKENVELENIHHHTYEPVGYSRKELLQVTKEYYAAVSGLDDQFGRLIQTLKEMGIYEDTLIVLSADHGDMMGSHGLMAKHVWYEESIGIPLVIGGGGLKKRICHTLIGSPDFMPTILGLLELPIPESAEGMDCSGDIKGSLEHPDHVCFLAACPGRDVFLEKFRKAGKNPMDFGWRGIRTRKYVYVIDVGYETTPKQSRHLYDLEEDPLQMRPEVIENSKEHPVAGFLESRLKEWLKDQNDGFLMNIEQ